jgi:hypothetical protein
MDTASLENKPSGSPEMVFHLIRKLSGLYPERPFKRTRLTIIAGVQCFKGSARERTAFSKYSCYVIMVLAFNEKGTGESIKPQRLKPKFVQF